MLSDVAWRNPSEPLPAWQHKKYHDEGREIFSLLANVDPLDPTALEPLHDDIQLFPGNMTVEQCRELLPGMVLQTAEFDFVNIDTEVFLPKLKEAGVLLDYSRYAGMIHGFWCDPNPITKNHLEKGFADTVKAIQAYAKKPGSATMPSQDTQKIMC